MNEETRLSVNFQGSVFEVVLPKSFSDTELVETVLDVLAWKTRTNANQLFSTYVIEERNGEVVVRKADSLTPRDAADYYQRFMSLFWSYVEYAVEAYSRQLSRLSILNSTAYAHPQESYFTMMTPDDDSNPFLSLKTVDDYYKPIKEFGGTWILWDVSENFFSWYARTNHSNDQLTFRSGSKGKVNEQNRSNSRG
jgi:hypothetical protein